jgi:hypothetical protein
LKPLFFTQQLQTSQTPPAQLVQQRHLQKLMTKMLQELSPMTAFHLKLYYFLTEKNTSLGQP